MAFETIILSELFIKESYILMLNNGNQFENTDKKSLKT